MRTATFDQWLDAVFKHPIRDPEWYWDENFETYWDGLGLSDVFTVEYMTRLLLGPGQLKPYLLGQVAQGIWFLIGESSPGRSAYALLNYSVPLSQRVDCVRAMTNFFRVFVALAAPGRANEQEDDFQVACYMWWDILPTHGGPIYGDNTGGEPEMHRACLDTMEEILTIPSELCQLSALHGLNHWHPHHAQKVEQIIDDFLQEPLGVTNRIIEYAAEARLGNAL